MSDQTNLKLRPFYCTEHHLHFEVTDEADEVVGMVTYDLGEANDLITELVVGYTKITGTEEANDEEDTIGPTVGNA